MPLIELDMLIAYVNRADKLHDIATELFNNILNGKLGGVAVPTSAYIEYELVLRSKGYSESEVSNDINAFRRIKNLDEVPLTSKIIVKASELRRKYNITYFDSLHAASAFSHDKTIISIDKIYKEIIELRVIDPRKLLRRKNRKY